MSRARETRGIPLHGLRESLTPEWAKEPKGEKGSQAAAHTGDSGQGQGPIASKKAGPRGRPDGQGQEKAAGQSLEVRRDSLSENEGPRKDSSTWGSWWCTCHSWLDRCVTTQSKPMCTFCGVLAAITVI